MCSDLLPPGFSAESPKRGTTNVTLWWNHETQISAHSVLSRSLWSLFCADKAIRGGRRYSVCRTVRRRLEPQGHCRYRTHPSPRLHLFFLERPGQVAAISPRRALISEVQVGFCRAY